MLPATIQFIRLKRADGQKTLLKNRSPLRAVVHSRLLQNDYIHDNSSIDRNIFSYNVYGMLAREDGSLLLSDSIDIEFRSIFTEHFPQPRPVQGDIRIGTGIYRVTDVLLSQHLDVGSAFSSITPICLSSKLDGRKTHYITSKHDVFPTILDRHLVKKCYAHGIDIDAAGVKIISAGDTCRIRIPEVPYPIFGTRNLKIEIENATAARIAFYTGISKMPALGFGFLKGETK